MPQVEAMAFGTSSYGVVEFSVGAYGSNGYSLNGQHDLLHWLFILTCMIDRRGLKCGYLEMEATLALDAWTLN